MAYSLLLRGTKEEKKIYLRITHGRAISVTRPTPFTINLSSWDNKSKQMKLSPDEEKLSNSSAKKVQAKNTIAEFNNNLNKYLLKFEDYFNTLRSEDQITEIRLLDFFLPEEKKKGIPTDLKNFVIYYCDMNIGIAESTKKVYNRTSNLVSGFYPKLRMQDIDDRFKKDFAEYLDKKNYQRSYIRKSLGNIRDFWKYAKRKGLTVSDDPLYWELAKEFPNIENTNIDDPYLTWEEIEHIKDVEFTNDYLDNARDWLLISIWTAQRVSDLMEFTFDKIKVDNRGEKFLTIRQEKTKKEITIPLFKEVEKILNKRNGNFPRKISHQKYNSYLKKVCETAKINDMIYAAKYRQPIKINGKTVYRKTVGYFPKWDVITSHIGRRTFVTLFVNNIDPETIMKITGHSRTTMVEVYNKLNSLERAEITKAQFKDAGIE